MSVASLMMVLALSAWSPERRTDEMASCMRARTYFPKTAPTAEKVCKCAVAALEKACPNEATVDECAQPSVVLPILKACKEQK